MTHIHKNNKMEGGKLYLNILNLLKLLISIWIGFYWLFKHSKCENKLRTLIKIFV